MTRSWTEVALMVSVPTMAAIVDIVIYGARLRDFRDWFDARCDVFEAKLSRGIEDSRREIERMQKLR